MRPPDLDGAVAKAWNVQSGEHPTSLAAWFVNGPFHPMWSWWAIALVRLRDVPGMPPAKRNYPEAEYEFIIMSVHPDHPPDPDNPKHVEYLEPIDVVEQFHGVTERDAVRIVEACVKAIVDGRMSPDSDWTAALQATVEHYRSGAHAEN